MKKLFKPFYSLFLALALSSALLPVNVAHAASLNDYAENKVVDDLFRGTDYPAATPASFYVALFTTSCTDAAIGTEVTGGSYARVGVTRAQSSWNGTHGNTTGASSGTNGTISNANAITFPAPTANWGSVTSFAVMDASTAGNPIVCTDLTTPKTINNGDAAPSFATGALTVQIDN